MTPTISVVIATYNRGARIARTLDSVLAQTVRPTEIIVMNDQSTDDTAAWIREHYPDVQVATVPNGGILRFPGTGARNGHVATCSSSSTTTTTCCPRVSRPWWDS